MNLTIDEKTTTDNGQEQFTFSADVGQARESFVAVIRKQYVSADMNLSFAVEVSHPATGWSFREVYQFAREQATQLERVKNDGGELLLANDTVAPKRTQAEARQLAIAASPLLSLLQRLVQRVPQAERTDLDADLRKLANEAADPLVGQYLPEGASWKTKEVPTVTRAEVRRAIAHDAVRKFTRKAAATTLATID